MAAAAAAAVTLTACGPVQMGAAAIIGSERVSTSTLSAQVSSLDRAYQAHSNLQAYVQYKPAQMPQIVLMWMVRFKVVDDIARRSGVQVTPGDAQRALAAVLRGVEQQTNTPITAQELAVLSGLPPTMVGQYARFEATIAKLAVAYTGAASPSSLTPAQQQQFSQRINAEAAAATKRLDIKINPRFGKLDAASLRIVNAPDSLSKPGSSV